MQIFENNMTIMKMFFIPAIIVQMHRFKAEVP